MDVITQSIYGVVGEQFANVGTNDDPPLSEVIDAMAEIERQEVERAIAAGTLKYFSKFTAYSFSELPERVDFSPGEIVSLHYPAGGEYDDSRTSTRAGTVIGEIYDVRIIVPLGHRNETLEVVAAKSSDIATLWKMIYRRHGRLRNSSGGNLLQIPISLEAPHFGQQLEKYLGWDFNARVTLYHNMATENFYVR